jgi:5-(carboxyamino)imidazole ribonucleotide synthase
MINVLGGPVAGSLDERFAAAMAAHPDAKVHTYGKAPRPGRKVGHVNVSGSDLDAVRADAVAAASFFLD